MNNEDRILLMLEKQSILLEQMQGDISDLKQGQAETNQRLDKLETKVGKLEQGQAKLEQGQAKLEQGQAKLEQGQAKLEKETTRIRQSVAQIEVSYGEKLGLLMDGQNLIYDKLEPIPAAVEILQEDVAVIKSVIIGHSKDINLLKTAT